MFQTTNQATILVSQYVVVWKSWKRPKHQTQRSWWCQYLLWRSLISVSFIDSLDNEGAPLPRGTLQSQSAPVAVRKGARKRWLLRICVSWIHVEWWKPCWRLQLKPKTLSWKLRRLLETIISTTSYLFILVFNPQEGISPTKRALNSLEDKFHGFTVCLPVSTPQ